MNVEPISKNGKESASNDIEENKDDSSTNLKLKRDEYQIEIRKKVRDDILNSKRRPVMKFENKMQAATDLGLLQKTPENMQLTDYIDQLNARNFDMSEFPQIVEAMKSDDRFKKHFGFIGLRKLLSVDNPPIQTVIDANVLPILIEYMQKDDEPHLQLESAWAVTNLAAGTSQQTKSIIDKGAIPLFVRLLKSPHPQIAEQAVWALGNISGDSTTLRDKVIQCGAVEPLVSLLKGCTDEMLLKQGIWTLSNLCRGKPLPKFQKVYKAIPPFAEVLKTVKDTEMLIDAAWALSYLSDGDEINIEMVLDTQVVPALVSYLEDTPLALLIPCIRIIGNICVGNEKQTNAVLKHPGFLDKLYKLLCHEKRAVKQEAAWIVSNLLTGTVDQIDMVIKLPGMVDRLMHMSNKEDTYLQKDAIWALSNVTNHGTFQQVYCLVEAGFIPLLVSKLEFDEDAKTIAVCLEAINNILIHGNKFIEKGQENVFLKVFESCGGTEKVEKLQLHSSDEVHGNALVILETFYDIDLPL